MTLLFGYLFSIGAFAVLSVFAVVWLRVRPGSIAARRTVAIVVFAYAAASIRAVPWVLSRPLVSGLRPFSAGDARGGSAAIVLLGASTFTVHERHQRLSMLDQNGAARVLEAAYVFRLFDSAWIISSGGAAIGVDLEPSALTMKDALVQLGIPGSRILLESASMNTRDEALLVAPMLHSLNADRTLLVTTDIHMRRALAAFRAAGVDAAPALSRDPVHSQSRLRSFIPTTDGLRFSRDVAHEYAGLLAYGVRGWLRF
jgi:uncharacterized SAM-binding protein YcdF (DUF218 family)